MHHEEGENNIYRVALHEKGIPFYEIALEIQEMKATCTCHIFEYVGIICKHILLIFGKKSLTIILPPHYIL